MFNVEQSQIDSEVIKRTLADARRFADITRANSESVSDAEASRLKRLAELVEAELVELERVA